MPAEIAGPDLLPVWLDIARSCGQTLERSRARSDEDRSQTDGASFAVMEERGLSEARTTDERFVQADLRALLLEDARGAP